MLEIIAIALLVAWLVAFASSLMLGGYFHLLLAVALGLVIGRQFRRRPAV
jgi:hypothetical protein